LKREKEGLIGDWNDEDDGSTNCSDGERKGVKLGFRRDPKFTNQNCIGLKKEKERKERK